MLEEEMSLAMRAEPPELPPRLDYTQCPMHGNTDKLRTHLYSLPEVTGLFRPEEKKAKSIKNMAQPQQAGHQHLQQQILLPHLAPQPPSVWVGVPVPAPDPHAASHVVMSPTAAVATAVFRTNQDA